MFMASVVGTVIVAGAVIIIYSTIPRAIPRVASVLVSGIASVPVSGVVSVVSTVGRTVPSDDS
jgi:hypothetical protein